MGMRLHLGSRSTGKGGAGSKLFLSVFFLLFAAVGTLFFVMGVRQMLQAHAVRGWTPTPCTIEVSTTRHDSADHRHLFEVRYSYTLGGAEPYQSTTVEPDYDGTDDASDAQRLAYRYPTGASATCYVNPHDPAQATLQLPGYGAIGISLFALPFMAIGYGGVLFTWLPSRSNPATQAISGTARDAKGAWIGVPFFGLFAVVGAGLLVPLVILPLWRITQARSWPAVACTILASSVQSHSDSDGTTYSVDILYRYEFDGKDYQSNRYGFTGGSSSGRKGKQAVVRQYPAGSRRTCYVNPADPFFAVLHRGATGMMWFGLIPLVFLIVGLGGVTATLVSLRRKAASRRDPFNAASSASPAVLVPSAIAPRGAATVDDADWLPKLNHDTPAVLQARRSSAVVGAVGILIFAALWNGIVWSLLVPEVIGGWRPMPSGFSIIGAAFFTLFAVPFVAVGVGMVLGFLYMILKSFNPLPRLTLDRAVVPLGGSFEIAWELRGKADRVRQLTLTFEGVEKATYRRGTDTTTDEHVFATLPIAEVDADRGQPLQGRATVAVPASTIHSFKSSNNQVCWRLRVKGRIRLWPDVSETFDVAVVPAEMSAP